MKWKSNVEEGLGLVVSMQGLVFTGNNSAELRDFDLPKLKATEVLIRIKASGLCGSDFESFRSDRGLRGPDGSFIAAGHEPAGVVEDAGALVTHFVSGDRVFVYHILGCGYCHSCRMGYPVSCSSPARAAYGGHRNGGHAEFLIAEERSLIHLPDDVSFLDGAMLACGFSTAFSATRKASITAGDIVLITGLGPVGVSVAIIAAALGAEVIGIDVDADRAAKSKEYGVAHTIVERDERNALDQVDGITGGRRADVAIDCTGSDQARHLCLESVGMWGRVIFIGFGGGQLTIDVPRLVITKQLLLRGSWVSSLAESEDAVRLISRHNVHPDRMASETYDLAHGAEAYRSFNAGAPGKIAIVMTGDA